MRIMSGSKQTTSRARPGNDPQAAHAPVTGVGREFEMKGHQLVALAGMAVWLGSTVAAGRLWAGHADYHPAIDPAKFKTHVENPYFPLVPGTTYMFSERVGKQVSDNEVTVTSDTRVIMGVTCTVVRDILREKGVVKEETSDWYAEDNDGNVWYFGEETKEYETNGKFSTEGSWEGGVNGAQPGVMMWGKPAPGEPYRQEYLAGSAEDMGQIVALNASATTPYGAFSGCVRTKEWSLLEPGTEKKWYAKGVGVVRTESSTKEVSTLVSITHH